MTMLNPFLYQRLRQTFGQVRVARAGEAADYRETYVRGYWECLPITLGEYYRVNCPYCGDTGFHLWINHRWGIGFGEHSRDRMCWAMICFRRGCFQGKLGAHRRRQLWRTIYQGRHLSLPLPETVTPRTRTVEPVPLPGECVPLIRCAASHKAVRYLSQRGFDWRELARIYDLRYCTKADAAYPAAAQRLIIPIYQEGKCLGWQGRYIGEPPTYVPKYVFPPRLSVSHLLYAQDLAQAWPFVVVVEGVTDAWSIGPFAVALFGKQLHAAQIPLLKKWSLVIVLLDADATRESQQIVSRLQLEVPTIEARLPQGDPASLPTDAVFDALDTACRKKQIDLLQLIGE